MSYGASRQTRPAPVERGEADNRAPAPAAAPDWADGEGTPLSAYALQPQAADQARLPRTHTVAANETLHDIAGRYQLPMLALIEQNGVEPPYALTPGRVLQLPPPRFHSVRRGESLEEIARQHSMDVRSLALLNRMQPPYRVAAGDRIALPAQARRQQAAAPAAPPSPAAPPEMAPAASEQARFAWPLQGELTARFGAQPDGGRLDGIEISGRAGAPVAAAAAGAVVYAGADLPAYGTLVLIAHADNYVTAYAYARRALVREGQRVEAGQAIAELDERGDGGARLLFQVRLGSVAIDPLPLLAPAR